MFFNKTPVKYLKWVGSARLEDLKILGIETVEDILFYLPTRYEDRRNPTEIRKLKPGEVALVTGKLKNVSIKRLKSRMTLTEAIIEGKDDYLKAIWFNQPYLIKQMKPGDSIWLYGKTDYGKYGAGFQMNSPDLEIVRSSEAPSVHTGRIVPVYKQIKNTGTKMLRRIIYNTLFEQNAEITENLPSAILRKRDLMPKDEAIKRVHFPHSDDNLDKLQQRRSPMHTRLIYEEFLMMQASLFLLKQKNKKELGIKFPVTTDLKLSALNLPPFQLTSSQKKTLEEIFSDMSSPYPMNRLLQGDVGSGKTIVALLAAYAAIKSGFQAALMVPTEILAEQHLKTATKLFSKENISIALLTSSSIFKNEGTLYSSIESGHTDLVVGTHALIQKGVSFKNLGLVIIDEQHRFGVDQRKSLINKGFSPDTLFMTATPIPRSLALTAFGSLDLSVIDKPPSGRKSVETILSTDRKRAEINEFIRKNIALGRQAFVVCPLIKGSEKTDLKAAEQTYIQIQDVFKDYSVDLLHGKMNNETKDSVMNRFSSGKTDILVTTSVIEVGIDIPNANIMLIEHSERFGLSQLHQLRGRIGRGEHKSYCILMISAGREGLSLELDLTEQAKDRLKIMRDSNDGFEIASKDLEIRGPGEFLGTRQSGIPRFRVADLMLDADILMEAYSDALWFFSLPNIEQSPDYKVFLKTLRDWWKENFGKKTN
jgi:ATP-dependent DNA helicase RecG